MTVLDASRGGSPAPSQVAGPRSLRQLLDAILVIGSDLDLPTVLQRVVESACSLVDARYGALGVLDETGTSLTEFITAGLDDASRRAIGALPKGNGILGALITDASPLRLADLREHPATFGFPPHHPPMRSFLGVPIHVGGTVFGNLYLADKTTSEVFSDVDEELAVGLAAAAGIAIDKARLHGELQRMALIEASERIARDLHDSVIQRVFGAGLMLQSTSRLVHVDPDAAVVRIDATIDELDLTVKHIRSAIFGISVAVARGATPGFRARVLELTREFASTLGFEPTVLFDGLIDAHVTGGVADDLAAVLTEGLSNVARHAGARRVEVHLIVVDEIMLRIEDDGIGPPPPDGRRGNGLDNLAHRANQRGGTFALEGRPGSGTILEWHVPLTSAGTG